MAGTENAITAEDARLHVQRLAAEDMAGRMTGSEGERRATEYVARVFEQLDLAPGGDNGSWYQSFPFTAGIRLGANNRLEISGVQPPLTVEPDRDWRPLGLSRVGEVPAGEIVFAGYGIVAPGIDGVPDYDSYGDLDAEGKWVMVFRFQPESVPPEWRRHLVHYLGPRLQGGGGPASLGFGADRRHRSERGGPRSSGRVEAGRGRRG
ncbi:MAG: hypothetical protein LJE91_06060 [Gammaproteobacteria bacterium]|nr:hypothetical protein [Gammaproteobacteria bacterium]